MYKENRNSSTSASARMCSPGRGGGTERVIPWPHELQERRGLTPVWGQAGGSHGCSLPCLYPSGKPQLTTKSNTYQWILYLPFWKKWISVALAHQGLLGSLNVRKSLTFDLACSLSGALPKRKTRCSYSPRGWNDMGWGKQISAPHREEHYNSLRSPTLKKKKWP